MWKRRFAQLKAGQGGFTLVEVLVAVMILVIMVFPITGMIVNGTRTVYNSAHRTMAANLAREKMEQVKSAGYEAAPGQAGVEELEGGFIRTTEVTDYPVEGVRQITVTVQWDLGVGTGPQSIEITSLLAMR
ncbi:MAG: prepilin-type N-terminal cleavage/methylation domain-containing protein [Dethiobacteria bacterium]